MGSPIYAVNLKSIFGVLLTIAMALAISPCIAADNSFNDTFEAVKPEDVKDSVFTLVGKDRYLLSAGTIPNHNSMTAGWGGFGILFEKPTAWSFLQADRYTLEKIRESKSYTMTFFDEDHKQDVLAMGRISGRNSDKMKETKLTAIQTPGGLPAFSEARLIFEVKLVEISTAYPDDFFTEEGRSAIEKGYQKAKEYEKMVFGEIVKVWRRKN